VQLPLVLCVMPVLFNLTQRGRHATREEGSVAREEGSRAA
jgi:hypothetical protein